MKKLFNDDFQKRVKKINIESIQLFNFYFR